MYTQHESFIFKQFTKNSWEEEVKKYIDELALPPNEIWYKSHRLLKKMNGELIPLGYYTKYEKSDSDNIFFQLKKNDDEADAVIMRDENRETIQIVSAFYDKEEALYDAALMRGENNTCGGWEYQRFKELQKRTNERINKKKSKNYTPVDTLLIAVNDRFVYQVKRKYPDIKNDLESFAYKLIGQSTFTKIVLVDSDLVGSGDIYTFP